MSFFIQCGQCKKPLKLPEETVGRSIKCPHCSSVFVAQRNGDAHAAKTSPALGAAASAVEKQSVPPPTVQVPCTVCKKPLRLPAALLGKSVKCPLCSNVFSAALAAAAPKPAAPPAPPAGAQKSPAPPTVQVPCTSCKKPLRLPEALLGKSVKCPLCSNVFTAQASSAIAAALPALASSPAPAKPAAPVPPVAAPPTAPVIAAASATELKPAPTAGPVPMEAKVSPAPTGATAPASGPALVLVPCTRCKRSLRLPESALGKRIKCPGCSNVFTAEKSVARVPTPSAAPPALPVTPAPISAPVSMAARVPAAPPTSAAATAAAATAAEVDYAQVVKMKAADSPSSGVKLPSLGDAEKTRPTLVFVACVRCKRPLRLPESALGKALKCPSCSTVFMTPSKLSVAKAAAPPPVAVSPPETKVLAPSAPIPAESPVPAAVVVPSRNPAPTIVPIAPAAVAQPQEFMPLPAMPVMHELLSESKAVVGQPPSFDAFAFTQAPAPVEDAPSVPTPTFPQENRNNAQESPSGSDILVRHHHVAEPGPVPSADAADEILGSGGESDIFGFRSSAKDPSTSKEPAEPAPTVAAPFVEAPQPSSTDDLIIFGEEEPNLAENEAAAVVLPVVEPSKHKHERPPGQSSMPLLGGLPILLIGASLGALLALVVGIFFLLILLDVIPGFQKSR